MKKVYESPSVEKIAFRYRDQIVAASGDENTTSGTPTIGSLTKENWGSNGCKYYVAEAAGWGICSYA